MCCGAQLNQPIIQKDRKQQQQQSSIQDQPLLYALVTTPCVVPSSHLHSSVSFSSSSHPPSVASALLGVQFSLLDLYQPSRIIEIRDKLLLADQLPLARRIWTECEHKNPQEFEQAARERIKQIRQTSAH